MIVTISSRINKLHLRCGARCPRVVFWSVRQAGRETTVTGAIGWWMVPRLILRHPSPNAIRIPRSHFSPLPFSNVGFSHMSSCFFLFFFFLIILLPVHAWPHCYNTTTISSKHQPAGYKYLYNFLTWNVGSTISASLIKKVTLLKIEIHWNTYFYCANIRMTACSSTTKSAVICECWLTMLTATTEPSILLYWLNLNVTLFQVPNSDLWGKWSFWRGMRSEESQRVTN